MDANGDAWDAAGVLVKNIGLLETDGATKFIASVCETADETLKSIHGVCS